VPSIEHIVPEDEFAHYLTHENDVSDPRYRRFLQPALDAVRFHMPPPARGLEFGCGPGPALAEMLRSFGYSIALYDLWFEQNADVLQSTYDFITLTEVAEHFRRPRHEFEQLFERLRPGGMLVIMTRPVPVTEAFETWYYRLDPTHVSFYRHETFLWLATEMSAELFLPRPDVAVLRKSAAFP